MKFRLDPEMTLKKIWVQFQLNPFSRFRKNRVSVSEFILYSRFTERVFRIFKRRTENVRMPLPIFVSLQDLGDFFCQKCPTLGHGYFFQVQKMQHLIRFFPLGDVFSRKLDGQSYFETFWKDFLWAHSQQGKNDNTFYNFLISIFLFLKTCETFCSFGFFTYASPDICPLSFCWFLFFLNFIFEEKFQGQNF